MTDQPSNVTFQLLLQELKHFREAQTSMGREQKEQIAALREEMKEEVGKLQNKQDKTDAVVNFIEKTINKWQGGGLILAGIGAFATFVLTLWEKAVKFFAH